MSARYLIRLDDACVTMNHHTWRAIEDLCDEFSIRPIVAVVPDNYDPELQIGAPDPRFWDKVRAWQDKGWAIGMHGCTHVMRPTNAKSIIPFHKRSEFAGLPLKEQAEAIRRSWNLFLAQSVEPTVWVAPAHSFDWLTLEALKHETPIRIISDGIATSSYFQSDFLWLPQQLWSFRARPFGLWTICLHPNTMTEHSLLDLQRHLKSGCAEKLTSVEHLGRTTRKKSSVDEAYELYFWQYSRLERTLLKLAHITKRSLHRYSRTEIP